MRTKPDLGFWQLWNLSFGFFGVQIAYALQSANVSRIFATIGADPHDLSYFWILPPLMGLLVQPVVGTLSDHTWNRFGRRLPYLIVGAVTAVIVMCLLPNAGSFGFTISGAILMGLVALMLLDTSINMAMQPFKMLVGDMVNERQKAKAYSIQSFLCNAGSIVGFVLPFLLAWIGIKATAPEGVVPPSVIWSFYIGAAVLILCVVYSMAKIKEWPPQLYNEYNNIAEDAAGKPKEKTSLVKLLVHAPKTFWTVSLVQFFCWFAFLFMWTYTTGTVAHKAFHTPEVQTITGLQVGDQVYGDKFLLVGDDIIVAKGHLMAAGVQVGDKFLPASTVAVGTDTLVSGHAMQTTEAGVDKASFSKPLDLNGQPLMLDGKAVDTDGQLVCIRDYLSRLDGPFTLTTASIAATDKTAGKLVLEGRSDYRIADPHQATFATKIDLNTSSKPYNEAGNWVGILFAVQAVGSVIWAMLLPRIGSRKFSYALSLVLGAVGFVGVAFITNPWLLFVPFLLIGCAWAAMLAWPFTILTNSLHGGNIGAYLGLFNCSITIPQIVGALVGGWLLSLFSTEGQLAPQYAMMIIAGISLAIGAFCVSFIREKAIKDDTPAEDPVDAGAI